MVFGGAYSTLRWEGAVVVGGDILIGNDGDDKESCKVEVSLSRRRWVRG